MCCFRFRALLVRTTLLSSLLWVGGLSIGYSAAVVAEPQQLVQQKVKELFAVHRRAKKALLRAISEPVISAYFAEQDPEKREALRLVIEQKTLKLQSYFKVSEMCLIDANGHEITRIEHGEISHDLSTEEAELPFFAAGFAAAAGEVITSPIYTSPDSHKVVVAYVSPVYINAKPVAIMHYEHDLSAFQQLLVRDLEAGQLVVAVNSEGRVIVDSRRAELSGSDVKTLRQFGDALFTSQMFAGLDVETVTRMIDNGDPIPGYSGAYKRVSRWTIYAFEATEAP